MSEPKESPTEILRRVSLELAEVADQDLGDGKPPPPLSPVRLRQAQETLIALYEALRTGDAVADFDKRLHVLVASGECGIAGLKLLYKVGIIEPFPWERGLT